MNTFDKITLESRREPMPFERLRFICYFVAGMIAEVLGFILLLVTVLCMAGVL